MQVDLPSTEEEINRIIKVVKMFLGILYVMH